MGLGELGEYSEGVTELRKLLDISPDNKEAAKLLARFKPHVRKANEQQKEMFARMAKGIGADEGGAAGSGEQHEQTTKQNRSQEVALPSADRSWRCFAGWAALLL